MAHRLTWRPGRVGMVLAVGAWSCFAAPALASPPTAPGTPLTAARQVTVQTYNLDLGADLQGLFGAGTIPDLVREARKAYDEVVANNFPERARALAAVIAAQRPDVVGLQEVALWEMSNTGPNGAYDTTYDYLALLLAALAHDGLSYEAVSTSENMVGAAPISADLATWVRYTDRNVVIVRAGLGDRKLSTDNPQHGVYAARIPVKLPAPLPPTAITRGWASVDVTVWGKTFTFVSTHLEAYGGSGDTNPFRNAQATELVQLLAAAGHPVVVTGDFNTRPTGCGNVNTKAYSIITGSGLAEVWPVVHQQTPCTGFTSGQRDLLDPANSLDHRIDDVFYTPSAFTPVRALVVGAEQSDRSTPTGFWPSDHASTVSTLRTTDWS